MVRIVVGVLVSAVSAFAQLQILTSSVPVATQYQSYSTAITASGGTPPYTWSVVSSTGVSLPEGMSLNPVTGMVSASQVNGQGGYAVTIQVADHASPANSATATLNFGVYSDSSYGGCEMFPPDNIYNQRIDQLPVDTTPSHQIPSSYLSHSLHPDFGHGFYPGPAGIPFMRVAANQPATYVNLGGDSQIDPGGTYAWPFPPWPNAVIEGTSYGQDGDDHHILVLQTSVNSLNGPETGPCILYETYDSIAVPAMFDAASNTWGPLAGLHYVLNSNEIAASEDTLDNGAQDSPGIPMVPLLIRYDEVPLGVRHPLRITFPSPTNWFAWPATGCCTGSGPPQGLLFRLKASVNWQAVCPVSSNPQAATLLQALQQYGAYMSDHGSAGFMQGVPDIRWDDDDLGCIKKFHVSDLEVVDNSMLEVSDLSGQTMPYVPPATLAGAAVGTAYSAAIGETGGNPAAIQWLVRSGALPPGLSLKASTGAITGTPGSIAGTPFTFSIAAMDTASGYTSQAQSFSIAVVGPSLAVAKSHTGNFTQGQTGATYTVTVANNGTGPTSGTVTVTETVPQGLTLVSMAGSQWTCPSGGDTCTRADGLPANSSYPAIAVTVNVSSTAASQVTNQVNVAGGGSGSASAQDVTTIAALPSQTITFGPLADEPYGTAAFPLTATASSGLAVSFASTTPATCSVTTLLAVGTCTIEATQPGNANWAAAAPVDRSFQVTPGSQTITFGTLSNQAFGTAAFPVSATASSGLAVSFASTTPAICSVTTLLAVGTCTIEATQPGNANWAAAAPVDRSFQVTPGSQTITFAALSNQPFGTQAFPLSATASSGLAVTFASTTPAICSVTTLLAVGTCTIEATQPGNSNWAAAAPVDRSFQVTPGVQTITFGALSNQVFGTQAFPVSATASSGLAVSFASTTPAICSVTALLAVGTCTIEATQPGNANWAAAAPVDRSFQVTPGSQTITFGALSNQAFGTQAFPLTATASSGLAVSFASTTPAICSVTTLLAVGTCTIEATQPGNANWAAAAPVDRSFQVTPGSQTITFGALSNQVFGTQALPLTATSSSGLAVSFASTTPAICSVTTLLAVGTCTIEATQPGNANWAAAAPVDRSFLVTAGMVTLGTATLSFPNTIAGKISAAQTVVFQNSGNSPLTIVSILPSGADAAHYQYAPDAAHPCPISPATLSAGASCTLDVAFAPQSQGFHNNAQLTITDNAGNAAGATQAVALNGTGIVLSSITVSAASASLAFNTSEPFTATGTYSDTSTANLTGQATWASSVPGVAAINSSGVATAGSVGQTSITAFGGVVSNSFQLTVTPGSPAAISAAGGAGQSSLVGTAFASPLLALVKDGGGNAVPNVTVTFTAPAGGASGTFSNGAATCTGVTNSSGVATSLVLAANSAAGSYSAIASTAGVTATASFGLTNLGAPVLTINKSHAGVFAQGQSGVPFEVTVGNAGAGPTSGAVTVTEAVPAGMRLVSVSGGPSWNCAVLPSCTTSAVLNPGSTYPKITVVVNVGNNAPGSLTNQVSVSGGGSAMATASDTASITAVSACSLTRTGNPGVADVQMIIDEALGMAPPTYSLSGGAAVSVADVEIVMNAAIGLGCSGLLPD